MTTTQRTRLCQALSNLRAVVLDITGPMAYFSAQMGGGINVINGTPNGQGPMNLQVNDSELPPQNAIPVPTLEEITAAYADGTIDAEEYQRQLLLYANSINTATPPQGGGSQ